MPSFPNLRDAHLQALIQFLTKQVETSAKDPDEGGIYSAAADGATMKYEVTGSRDFVDAEGYPAITPPWGTLNAIDLNTGRYLWKIPFGEYPELVAKGVTNTGSENYGGPIVTAGNLLFIGCDGLRQEIQSFRQQDWKGALGNGSSFCGHRNARDLYGRRQAIRGDCQRWEPIHKGPYRQRIRRVLSTVSFV